MTKRRKENSKIEIPSLILQRRRNASSGSATISETDDDGTTRYDYVTGSGATICTQAKLRFGRKWDKVGRLFPSTRPYIAFETLFFEGWPPSLSFRLLSRIEIEWGWKKRAVRGLWLMDEDEGGFCPDWVLVVPSFCENRVYIYMCILFCREDVLFGIRWIGK